MLRNFKLASMLYLLSASLSYAAAPGFYIGAGMGPENADFDQHARLLVHPPGSTHIESNVTDSTHLSGTGLFGTLFAGYGWSKQQFYLAGEVNVNVSSVIFQSKNNEYIHQTFSKTKYRMEHGYGISLIPGYLYSPNTLFYARIGYTNDNLKISTSDVSLANINKNLSGYRFGLGIQEYFTQHMSARMEYSQANYQNEKFTVILPAITKTTKIIPQTGQVEFSLIYNI